jgi:thiol-disulfide isomerase/thioredoxin
MKIYIPFTLCSLSILAACNPATQSQVNSNPVKLEVGMQMPQVQLLDFKGGIASTNALRGKPVVYNFWATWCGPCRAEMPDLNQIQERYKSKGLVVVGVNVEERKSLIENFLKVIPLNFEVWYEDKAASFPHDKIGPIIPIWQGQTDQSYFIPYTVFVKASGEIAAVQRGYDASGRNLIANVEVTLK